MVIQHNIAAVNAYRNLDGNKTNLNKNLEKLSSGFRINRSADDAAGLAISEQMRSKINGLDQATSNAKDAIGLIQTTEGALTETHSMLQRMKTLATQSANGTYNSIARDGIQQEIDALSKEIDRIAQTTDYNGIKPISQQSTMTMQVGPTSGETLDVPGADMSTKALKLKNVGGTELSQKVETDHQTYANAKKAYDDAVAADAAANVSGGTQDTASSLKPAMDTAKEALDKTIKEGGSFAKDLDDALTAKDAAKAETDAANAMTVGGSIAQQDIDDAKAAAKEKTDAATEKYDAAKKAAEDGKLDVTSVSKANAAITTIENAINTVSSHRAKLGAAQNRLEHTINNLKTTSENMTDAESRIRDTDMAKEIAAYTKNNILNQAAQSMLAQANQQPQGVLQLLG